MDPKDVNPGLALGFGAVVILATVMLAKFSWQHQVDVVMTLDVTETQLEAGISEKLRGIRLYSTPPDKDPEPGVDVAFFEAPDFLIKHDAEGPYFEIVTEKNTYIGRLENKAGPFAGQIHIELGDDGKPKCLWVYSELQETWLPTRGCVWEPPEEVK